MNKKYTTELSKGQGMVDETITLLNVWSPGMSSQELISKAVSEGILSKATAIRTKDIVSRQFTHRYLINGDRPAYQLKCLLLDGIPLSKIRQMLLIHTARANRILHDYICYVYWSKYQAAQQGVTKEDALQFIRKAVNNGLTITRWSENMIDRVARYLNGCLYDFGLVEDTTGEIRRFTHYRIERATALYLTYDIHFSGHNDTSILHNVDWQLFGLEPMDVRYELERVSPGFFMMQFAGDLLRVTWKHKTMEDALHAIAAAEL